MRCAWVFILAAPLAFSGEVWVFLKDGRVGFGDPTREPVELIVADGATIEVSKDLIEFQRTREQVDQGVQAMIQDMARGRNIEEHTKRFRVLKTAAVPKLLTFVNGTAVRERISALFALQHAWTNNAEEPVLKALSDSDWDIRRTAFAALARNVPQAKLAERIRPFADAEDTKTAALVFELVDKYYPDPSLKRIQRLLRDSDCRTAAMPRISHYLTPALTDDTLALLDSTDLAVQRGAVAGLISQLADGEAERTKVRRLLASPDGDLREIAGEYFAWLGRRDDVSALQEALAREKDLHARASLQAAVNTIEKRAAEWAKKAELADELEKIRKAEVLEPTFVYSVHEHARKREFLERVFRLEEVLAAPGGAMRGSRDFAGEAQYPAAESWTPPVRDYFDPQRKSFGFCVTQDYVSFVGGVHIGDDAAWGKELRTVVAAAAGIVRRVMHIFSWGFIVVIEHRQPDGQQLCSVYAHLSPFLHVKPGDVVAAGQKIGSTGRHYSVENGGYTAHTHFGIHRGPFSIEDGCWVHGYINRQEWEEGKHGWIDPQAFLKNPTAK